MKKIITVLIITALLACALVSCTDSDSDTSPAESSTVQNAESSAVAESSVADESAAESESESAAESVDESESTDESVDESDTSEESKEEIKVQISIEHASEELLADKDSYVLYDDPETDYSFIVIRTEATVTNFRYFSIVSTDTWSDDGAPKVDEVLYTIDEFTPDTVFVAETVFADVYAIRGLSFVDANGNTQYYSLYDSAVDDTIGLQKSEIAE